MRLSRLRRRALEAHDAWLAAAGPWARWSVCLPLLGPGLDELPRSEDIGRRRRRDPRARALAAGLLREPALPSLFMLDLAPALGLRVAAELARQGLARPLLLLGRWPYAQAVLPARPVVDAAIAESRGLSAAPASHVVVVLDAERARASPGRPAADRHADNRYELVADDFPDAPTLASSGIRRVVDVRSPADMVPPLLAARVYPTWAAAGLLVESACGP